MLSLSCRSALRFAARPATLRAALSTGRCRAALLATGLVLAALTLAPAAAHANQYRVEITNLRSGFNADVMWASTAPFQGRVPVAEQRQRLAGVRSAR